MDRRHDRPERRGDEPGEGKIKQTSTFVSQKGEADDIRKQNYQESLDWYAGIVADVFG